jgi:hypothetical protein
MVISLHHLDIKIPTTPDNLYFTTHELAVCIQILYTHKLAVCIKNFKDSMSTKQMDGTDVYFYKNLKSI